MKRWVVETDQVLYIVSDEDVNQPGYVNILIKKIIDDCGVVKYDVAKRNSQMSHEAFINDGYELVRVEYEYYKNSLVRKLQLLKNKFLF